jgi:hypothetical protein
MLADIQNRISFSPVYHRPGLINPDMIAVHFDGKLQGHVHVRDDGTIERPFHVDLHGDLYGSEVDGRKYHTLQGAAIALVETLSSRNLLTITE